MTKLCCASFSALVWLVAVPAAAMAQVLPAWKASPCADMVEGNTQGGNGMVFPVAIATKNPQTRVLGLNTGTKVVPLKMLSERDYKIASGLKPAEAGWVTISRRAASGLIDGKPNEAQLPIVWFIPYGKQCVIANASGGVDPENLEPAAKAALD